MQQTKSFCVVINRHRQKASLEHGTAEIVWWKGKINVFLVLFTCQVLFQMVGAATEKARLRLLSIALRTKKCLETDDLRVLEIARKCSTVTK